MRRRDLLLLRMERGRRVVEVSCATLYMQFLDARALAEAAPAGASNASSERDPNEPWLSEPPREVSASTTAALFEGLQNEFKRADVVRIVDREWLACDELRSAFEPILDEYVARGGRTEFPTVTS